MKFHVETREVLAGAYLGPNKHQGRMLSHAAVVTDDGAVARVLCRRVSVDSLADRGASNPSATPTCDRCRAAIKKRVEAAAPEAP